MTVKSDPFSASAIAAADAKRLATLKSYEITNTPPERGFDDIVMLATQLCETSVGLVSLVEADRQWFKARLGFEPFETPLDQSVCSHALGSPDLLVIPDLALDERTRHNSLVTSKPFIRFYAGAPLTAPNGQVLGTLCVIDPVPRPQGLTPHQAAGLAALAKLVVDLLELRRITAEQEHHAAALAKSESKWRSLFEDLQEGFMLAEVIRDENGKICNWRYEEVNRAWGDLVGLPVEQSVGRTVRELIPGIEDEWFNRIANVVETGETIRFTRQIGTLDRWYDGVCQPAGGDRFTVIFLEVTEQILAARQLQLSQDRYKTLVENVDVGICIVEMKFDADNTAIDYRIVEGNSAYEQHTGLIGSVGKWVSEIAPGLEPYWFEIYGNVALTGEPACFENKAEVLRARWFEVQAHRVGDPADKLVAILFKDITDRRRAEEERQALSAELSHRLKNTLAMVQAIASQSLRQAETVKEGREAVAARLGALARMQDILTDAPREGAYLRDVLDAAIAPHQSLDGRIQISGPQVRLTPQQVLGISLAVHELSTNAVKYGALTNGTGCIDMRWTCSGSDFRFIWSESNGPLVNAPNRKGFGSRLMEQIVGSYFDGTGAIEYNPAGLRFQLVGIVEN